MTPEQKKEITAIALYYADMTSFNDRGASWVRWGDAQETTRQEYRAKTKWEELTKNRQRMDIYLSLYVVMAVGT